MIFIFKVDVLDGLYFNHKDEILRTVQIGGSNSLDDLAYSILRSLKFDVDHLYHFSFGSYSYAKPLYCRKPSQPSDLSSKEKLYRLGLKNGQVFYFLYDYGDCWEFEIQVIEIRQESGDIPTSILDSHGVLEQYPIGDWDSGEEIEEAEKALHSHSASDHDLLHSGISSRSAQKDLPLDSLPSYDEIDLSSEYFEEDDSVRTDNYNPRLGRMMLRITEHQISTGNPQFVREAYVQLQKKGYIRKLAKTKLALALLNELFEILKKGLPYSEPRYRGFIEEVVNAPFDEFSVSDIETGQERELSKLLDEFENVLFDNQHDKAADIFIKTWPLLKKYIDNNYTRETDSGLQRYSIWQIQEALDFRMELFNAINDADIALLNAGRYEDGLAIFFDILSTFVWTEGNDHLLRAAIGTCYQNLGRSAEADQWYMDWLNNSSNHPSAVNSYILYLQEKGETDKALDFLEHYLPEYSNRTNKSEDISKDKYLSYDAYEDQLLLYTRAIELSESLGDQQRLVKYQKLLGQTQKKWKSQNILYPANKPVVNNTKIYPNDPCPCGSGKKYKKCCGRK